MTKYALISAANKQNIAEFAAVLIECGYTVLSTGGTAKLLRDRQLEVTDVSDYTQSPELLDGRVKSLHPKIHAGILARRDQDLETLQTHDIYPIDIVVANFYPFENTINRPDCDEAMAIENIDVGGPTMARAAAKNFKDVTVIIDPNDYPTIIKELKENSGTTRLETRRKLAGKVFQHTAA